MADELPPTQMINKLQVSRVGRATAQLEMRSNQLHHNLSLYHSLGSPQAWLSSASMPATAIAGWLLTKLALSTQLNQDKMTLSLKLEFESYLEKTEATDRVATPSDDSA